MRLLSNFRLKAEYISFYLIVLFIFILLFGEYLGCTKKPSKGIKLVVRTGLESEGLRKVAEEYFKLKSIKVNVLELGRDGYMSAVPTQLITGSASFDVAFLPSTMIAELAKGNALAPLDDKINVNDPDIIASYGYQNKTYALPCDISTMFLYYRKDLIAPPLRHGMNILK